MGTVPLYEQVLWVCFRHFVAAVAGAFVAPCLPARSPVRGVNNIPFVLLCHVRVWEVEQITVHYYLPCLRFRLVDYNQVTRFRHLAVKNNRLWNAMRFAHPEPPRGFRFYKRRSLMPNAATEQQACAIPLWNLRNESAC